MYWNRHEVDSSLRACPCAHVEAQRGWLMAMLAHRIDTSRTERMYHFEEHQVNSIISILNSLLLY